MSHTVQLIMNNEWERFGKLYWFDTNSLLLPILCKFLTMLLSVPTLQNVEKVKGVKTYAAHCTGIDFGFPSCQGTKQWIMAETRNGADHWLVECCCYQKVTWGHLSQRSTANYNGVSSRLRAQYIFTIRVCFLCKFLLSLSLHLKLNPEEKFMLNVNGKWNLLHSCLLLLACSGETVTTSQSLANSRFRLITV